MGAWTRHWVIAFSSSFPDDAQWDRDDVFSNLERAFEAARLPVGRKTVRRSRALGAYIQPTLHSAAEVEDAKRFGGHDTLLNEIATLNFLGE